MKKLVIILFFGFLLGCFAQSSTTGTVTMPDDSVVKVEIADQISEKWQGLSGRESLEAGQGMLFIFNKGDYPGIWMKGMEFSIDIVFINDQEIVDIVESAPVPKASNYPTYKPQSPSNYVLELPAGSVAQYQLKQGDRVEIQY